VVEDVLDVARRARRVDRRADRTDEAQCEVEERPLEARPREERECVPLANPEREQPVRQLVDRQGRFGARDLPPLASGLVEVGRVGVAVSDRAPRTNSELPELGLPLLRMMSTPGSWPCIDSSTLFEGTLMSSSEVIEATAPVTSRRCTVPYPIDTTASSATALAWRKKLSVAG
jgi:hypothetical protein